jgi:hypothetical protein
MMEVLAGHLQMTQARQCGWSNVTLFLVDIAGAAVAAAAAELLSDDGGASWTLTDEAGTAAWLE